MKTIFRLMALLIATAAVTSCGNQNTSDTKRPARQLIHHDGVQIAYTDTGKNDTTLLFVHGWGINKSYWADQIKKFAPTYRVVAMDMAGFGESGKNRDTWTVKDFAGDVDSVIKQLDLKKVILIGHSMAGDVVLQSAVDNRERVVGLVGIDNFKSPGAAWSNESKRDYESAMEQLRKNFKPTVTAWFNQELFHKTTSKQVRSRVMADVYKADPNIAVASLEDTTFHEIPKLKEARKKLYVLGSDASPVDTTHLSAAKLPFKVYYVKQTGHYPMIENPQEFNAQLEKILSEISRDN